LNDTQLFFETFNSAAEEGYNKAFEGKTPDEALKMNEEDIYSFLQKSIEKWSITPLSGMQDQTPRRIIEEIKDLIGIIEYFKIGSILCDKDLPEILLKKVKSYGEEAENELIKLASDGKLIEDDKNIYISLLAIRILGKWKVSKAIPSIILAMDFCTAANEIVFEEVMEALISMGTDATNTLINRLNEVEDISSKEEYILTALVKIACGNKSDEVFGCIKNTFNKMDDKLLGAMCLGDYGDWRAIATLKGFIKKSNANIKKDTYLEIKAAIKRLGGDISDI